MWSSERELAVNHGMRFIGQPYYWGGQGPAGFDCSGLMVEMFRACGKMSRRDDLTAQGLYTRFKHLGHAMGTAPRGTLVFYGKDLFSITHVEMVVGHVKGRHICLGAVGGGSGMDTLPEAQARDAMVTLRPIRGDVVAMVDPFGDS